MAKEDVWKMSAFNKLKFGETKVLSPGFQIRRVFGGYLYEHFKMEGVSGKKVKVVTACTYADSSTFGKN